MVGLSSGVAARYLVGPRRPGLHDVAKVAGVSHQTVSRVVNDFPGVRSDTRERVQRAIEQLGYRRNTAARTLATRRSGVIGILTPRSSLFGPTSTVIAVEAAARDSGFFVSLASVDEHRRKAVHEVCEYFLEQGVDALVVVAPDQSMVDEVCQVAVTLPVVLISSTPSDCRGLFSVAVDNELGARDATRYLLELGHRNIAHLAGPVNSLESQARVKGWAREMAEAGVDGTDICHGDWSAASGFRVGRDMLGRARPTAVFVGNDQMALGLVRAARDLGMNVPADLSVIGFDDMDGVNYLDPPLTTVRQDFGALGSESLRVVKSLLVDNRPESILLPPHLVVRGSAAAPPTLRSTLTLG